MNDDLAAEAATWVPPWQRPATEARDATAEGIDAPEGDAFADDAFADDADDPGCEIVGETEARPAEADDEPFAAAEPAEAPADEAEPSAAPPDVPPAAAVSAEPVAGAEPDPKAGVGSEAEAEPAAPAAEAEAAPEPEPQAESELAAEAEPAVPAEQPEPADAEVKEGQVELAAEPSVAAVETAPEPEAEPVAVAEIKGAGLPQQWAGLAGTRWQDSPRMDEEPAAQQGEREPSVGVAEQSDADEAPIIVPEQRGAEERLPAVSAAELTPALEAILMVVDEPVNEITLAQVLDVQAEQVANALIDLSATYTREGRGFDLRRAAGGWRFYTRGDYSSYVEKFVLDGQQMRLTQASLETLAVVAYKQPVTRSRISAIRGVNCDGVIRTLVTRGMIEECGTDPDSGAHLYRTTTLFLEKLGLDSVEQLPPLAPFLPDNLDEVAAGG